MIGQGFRRTTAEIAAITGGRLEGSPAVEIAGVSTDTRENASGALFVALKGQNHDAHGFLDQAIAQGARALLVEARPGLMKPAGIPVIEVADTLIALGRLAHAHRKAKALQVVAVTGSNGKTTAKEMIASILGVDSVVLKTEGNLNNLIGLPMTLLRREERHAFAVLEMGMNAKGEIAELTRIAEPDVGLITNVGPAHVGELGSIEAVADAKGELFAGLAKSATRVVNLDDPRVVAQEELHPGRSRSFGFHGAADVKIVEAIPAIEGQRLELEIDGWETSVRLQLPGRHNALNAAGAAAAATAAGASVDAVVKGLEAVGPVKGRLVYKSAGDFIVIDDTYNANTASMIAAIETTWERARREGRRLLLALGEMRELGIFSAAEHARVGKTAADAKVAAVAAFGKLARPIYDEVKAAGVPSFHSDDDLAALVGWLRGRIQAGDHVLVKGSRGMKMERVVEALGAKGGAH